MTKRVSSGEEERKKLWRCREDPDSWRINRPGRERVISEEVVAGEEGPRITRSAQPGGTGWLVERGRGIERGRERGGEKKGGERKREAACLLTRASCKTDTLACTLKGRRKTAFWFVKRQ